MIDFKIILLVFTINFYLTSASQRISTIKCKEYESITQIAYFVKGHPSFPASKVYDDKCQRNGAPLVVGGTEVKISEFPHQALLGYNVRNRIRWSCGGSLISPNFILTAAHCLDSKETGPVQLVKLGMVSRVIKSIHEKVYSIEEKYKHDGYHPRTKNNDIALLKLNDSVIFDEHAYPICLPNKQHEADAIVTGFGTTGEYDANSVQLLKAPLQRFSHQECQDMLPNNEIFRNTMICYGHRNMSRDSCRGDSGGPLQMFNDKESKCTYTQIGVVSFGPKTCGTKGLPGVYANVYDYLDWIEGIVWKDKVSQTRRSI